MTWSDGASIVTASPERFLALNGGRSAGLVARAIAAVDAHTPLVHVRGGSRVSHFHAVDVAILGANSLLGAICARSLLLRGKSVFFGVTRGLDGLPVGLIDDPAFQQAVESSVGFVDQSGPSSPWGEKLARYLFGSRGAGTLLVPSATFSFELGTRVAGEELVLFGNRSPFPSAQEGDEFVAAVHGEARRNGVVAGLGERRFRRPVVLAKKVVLTSFVDGFDVASLQRDGEGVAVSWTNRRIAGLGTARRSDDRVRDAVSAIYEDLIEASGGAGCSL